MSSALSHWFPRIQAAKLPVPRTVILEMTGLCIKDVWGYMDGHEPPSPELDAFVESVVNAGHEMGWPCFLRTDHTSGKHEWGRTCYLENRTYVRSHILALADYSESVDMIGLPWGTWAVRELLPSIKYGVCPGYCDMPIAREFRWFVREGHPMCAHPYWPEDALRHGRARLPHERYRELSKMTDSEQVELHGLVSAAGIAVGGGDWSIDVLATERGWFITDMAEAKRSWHWPDCKAWSET